MRAFGFFEEHGAGTDGFENFLTQRVFAQAIDEVDAAHARVQCAKAIFHLYLHAAGDGAVLDVARDFFGGDDEGGPVLPCIGHDSFVASIGPCD